MQATFNPSPFSARNNCGSYAGLALANPATLKKGNTGSDVKTLQDLLKKNNFMMPGSTSGQFDEVTYASVINFQSSKGLDIDGIVGPQTWSALSGKTYTAPAAAPAAPTYDPASLATVDADQDEPFYKQSWFLPVAVGAGLLFFGVPIVLLATR